MYSLLTTTTKDVNDLSSISHPSTESSMKKESPVSKRNGLKSIYGCIMKAVEAVVEGGASVEAVMEGGASVEAVVEGGASVEAAVEGGACLVSYFSLKMKSVLWASLSLLHF